MEEKLPDFKFPTKLTTHTELNGDVIAYSFYLKLMGADQSLSFGDWYYTKNEDQETIARIYNKTTMDTGDFDFWTSSNYVRMISQQEALDIIKELGYDIVHSMSGLSLNNRTTVCINGVTLGVVYTVESSCEHAAYLKAAYLASVTNKNVIDNNKAIESTGLFKVKGYKEL